MTYRFRFVWNKAKHRDHRARSLAGVVRPIETETADGHYLTLWIDTRKLLVILAASGVVLWFLAAGVLEVALDRNPYNRVKYVDLAFPWRWKNVRDLRGQGYITSGLEKIRAGQIPAGLMKIRQGLARHPDAAAARLTVGRIYARANFYRGVREVMLPQLKESRPPREYLEFFLNAANISDDHATVVAACDETLASTGLSADDRAWLLVKKADALVVLERFPEALAALDAAGRDRSLEWRRIRISATIGSGHAAEAVAEIKGWSGNVPRDFRLQMLVRASARAGSMPEALAAAKELQQLHPDEMEPWALAVGAFDRAGWHDAAWSSAQDAVRRFGADTKAMEALERTCSETRSVELLTLCLENAREEGQAMLPTLIDLTVALLQHGEVTRAEQTYEQVLAENRRLREPEQRRLGSTLGSGPLGGQRPPTLPDPVRDWLRSLIDAVELPVADPGGAHTTVLDNQRIPPALFAVSADVLSASGHWPALRELARIGLTKYPGSTLLSRRAREAADKVAAMPKAVPTVVSAPVVTKKGQEGGQAASTTPTMVPAVVKYNAIAQEQFFAKIEDAAHRGAWAEVENEIRNVISAAPSWLPQVEADLTWRQVRAALEQSEALRATLVMGGRLRTHPLEATRALALVRDWQGRNDHETALKLAETLVAAVPEFRPGQALLKELRKPLGATPASGSPR